MDNFIMCMKGKGKGKFKSWKGKGDKGKGKGDDGGKGGKGDKGKGKGKGIKGACWNCNEIGHRANDCPKKKTDVNHVAGAHEEEYNWEDEEDFGEDAFWTGGHLAALEAVGYQPVGGRGLSPAPRAPPGLPTPIKNRWKLIAPDDKKTMSPMEYHRNR